MSYHNNIDVKQAAAMTDLEEKTAFAAQLLKTPTEPFKAALLVFPFDTGRALRIANEWPNDPDVLAAIAQLNEDYGELAFLPTKADVCREIWSTALQERIPVEDKTKLLKLYAEVRGFVEKPNQSVNVNVNDNKVMVIRDQGTNEEWENKAAKQQAGLLSVSTSRH